VLSGLLVERSEPEGAALRAEPKAGDARAEAFRTLVDAELDRSYRLAAVILGDRFDAEDAVHDAAETAWRRWADLREADRFGAWFGRILVNGCRDRLRRRRRRGLVEVSRVPVDAEHPVAFDEAAALGLRDVLRRAADVLAPEERIVVVLRYGEDLTVPAIAELIGVADGTVKSRLHRALGKLRSAIEEAGE
jgi:RNA polymerase sigma factor (sigma-70 family)